MGLTILESTVYQIFFNKVKFTFAPGKDGHGRPAVVSDVANKTRNPRVLFPK